MRPLRAVFWMNPDAGPSQTAGNASPIIAQLTLPAGSQWGKRGVPLPTVAAQGRPMMHGLMGEMHPDWVQRNIAFLAPAGGEGVAPPPPGGGH